MNKNPDHKLQTGSEKLQEKLSQAKETYHEKVRPILQEKSRGAQKRLKEGKDAFDEKVAPKIMEQAKISREAAKGYNLFTGIKENFWKELATNGIALIVAFSISKLISHFFVVKTWHSFFRHGSSHQMQVSEGTMAVISLSLEFVIGLLVFTFIEHFIENYLAIKDAHKHDNSDLL